MAASVPLVGMDAWLYRRTRASTEGLASRLAQQATVVRDGAAKTIPALEVVPGDLALVAAGEAFPADGLLVAGVELQIDESALSGEALPVRKRALSAIPRDGDEPAVDAIHWGLAGTRLLTGEARLRVVHTGRETLYGEIVRSAIGGGVRTPLQQALARLVSVLVVAAVLACVGLAVVRLRQGYGAVDALVSAATLAVAALPEEFPVVFGFFLGVGVYRLAKRQALVRRAVSVENIGRVTSSAPTRPGPSPTGVRVSRTSSRRTMRRSATCSRLRRWRRGPRAATRSTPRSSPSAKRAAWTSARRRGSGTPPSRSPRTGGARPRSCGTRTDGASRSRRARPRPCGPAARRAS